MNVQLAKALLIPLFLALAAPAQAYYYGHYGHHGYGYGYGHHGYGYGRHGFGYGHHGYGRHRYRYGHGYGHGYGYRGYGVYPHRHGLIHGLLSIPGQVAGAVVGYPAHHHSSPGGSTPPAGNRTYDNPPASDGTYGRGATTGGSGWSLLADGRYSQALSVFARKAEGNPRDGMPKIGYALSAAAGEDLERGVWAMRRAVRIDPESLRYVSLDEGVGARLEQLLARYQSKLDRVGDDAGAAFMVVSLYYLMGDRQAARGAIARAAQDGDRSPSTRNLQQLIDDRDAGGSPDLALGSVPGDGQ